MAYVPGQDNTQNKSLTSKELMPTLVASSAFLQYQKGVSKDVARGETVPVAQLAGDLEEYTGADLTGDTTADAGGTITVNNGQGWSRLVRKADQDRSAIDGLAQKYGDMYNRKMAAKIDASIAAEGATTTTKGTLADVTLANVETVVSEAISILTENNVDRGDIHGYVPSWMYNLIARAQGRNVESTSSAVSAGVVLPYLGIWIHESNVLASDVVTSGYKSAIFAADWALQYAIGSMASEIVPADSKNFGNVTKGYTVWGTELLDNDAVVATEVKEG